LASVFNCDPLVSHPDSPLLFYFHKLFGQKKPTVPIYASNMTLLEPTKGAPTLIPEVPLVDTNKEVEVKDLPPVQFDWTSSGLTNPLEVNNKHQHLDFLNIDDSELTAKKGMYIC
ncbi:hypothetical protein AM593_10390, partial [Mytilus galloprovincialis]